LSQKKRSRSHRREKRDERSRKKSPRKKSRERGRRENSRTRDKDRKDERDRKEDRERKREARRSSRDRGREKRRRSSSRTSKKNHRKRVRSRSRQEKRKKKRDKKYDEEEYKRRVANEIAEAERPKETEIAEVTRKQRKEERRLKLLKLGYVKIEPKEEDDVIKKEVIDEHQPVNGKGEIADYQQVLVKVEPKVEEDAPPTFAVPAKVDKPPKISLRKLIDDSEDVVFRSVEKGAVEHVREGGDGGDVWDIFSDEEDENVKRTHAAAASIDLARSKDNIFNIDNWDDSEQYYIFRLGDIVYGKYEVFGNQGRGVFSSVLRVRSIEEDENEYVIKVIRNNDTMRKAGMKEIEHLLLIGEMDPHGTKHCVRLFNHFDHRNHLCLVFEPMHCNLRQLIKTVGAGRGFHIRAVQTYAKQIFKALQHLVRCRIIHADIKPDNILISSDRNLVKICDFGSAMKPEEVELTPILGSRYYRAAEVMVGHLAAFAIDMWAMGCVLSEVYTGKILFRGDPDNNKMLSKIVPLCGRYPPKFGRAGAFYSQHFDENGDFLERTEDVNGQQIQKRHAYQAPQKDWLTVLHPSAIHYKALNAQERTKVNQFKDLLTKCFMLDPIKRLTPQQALIHPFVFSDKKKKHKKSKRSS